MTTRLLTELDVAIPLRDGVRSFADVWRPDVPGPVPAVLVRTPYDKSWGDHYSPLDPRHLARRGYALVVQDVRGRGASEGDFTPFVQERHDGADSIAWLADQEWCSGDVVMSGWSYVGATQWLAALERPPALRAIAPANSSDCYGEGWSFRNGVEERALLASWSAVALADPESAWADDVARAFTDDAGVRALFPPSERWLGADPTDPYWAEISAAGRTADLDLAVLHIGGWYDVLVEATLAGWRRRGSDRDALIVGPWAHDNWFSHLVADRNLGAAGSGAAFGLADQILDFYDAAIGRAPRTTPPVQVFALGSRTWSRHDSWPPPGAEVRTLPLVEAEFDVDPADLPPSIGGRAIQVGVAGSGWGPVDQTPLAGRGDVVSTDLALPAGESIAGPCTVRLVVEASGGTPRQWTAVLAIRAGDGRLDVLTEGVAQAPTTATRIDIPLGDVHLGAAADRATDLVLLLAGGSVPRWRPVDTAGHHRVLAGSAIDLTISRAVPAGQP